MKKIVLFILSLYCLPAFSQIGMPFPTYIPTDIDTTIVLVAGVNGATRSIKADNLVKYRAALAAHDTANALRLLIPTNNNQLTNGANYITSSAIAGKLNISDTAVMLSPYARLNKVAFDSTLLRGLINTNTTNIATNTSNIASNTTAIGTKLNISDTTNKWLPIGTSISSSSSSVKSPVWNRRGAVLNATTSADQDNTFEPSVIYDSTTTPVILTGHTKVFRMWYTSGWTTPQINYAESLDGVSWTPYASNPVITGHARSFVMQVSGGSFVLYASLGVSGTQIDRYTSTNGATWTQTHTNVVPKVGAWCANGLYNMSVINDGGTYRMIIDGAATGQVYSEGYYTSSDNITWTQYGSNPVLSGKNEGSPFLQKVGSTYWIWCGPTGTTSSNLPTDIARYSSPDMITWTRNPVENTFKRRTADEGPFTSVGQVQDVYLTAVDTSVYMYYAGSADGSQQSGKQKIKLAIAPMSFASLVQTSEGDNSVLPAYSGGTNELLYGTGGGGLISDASLTYKKTGTYTALHAKSFSIKAAPTATQAGDTLTAFSVDNAANANGFASTLIYDMRINKNLFKFDNLYNYSIGVGNAAQPTTNNTGTFFVGNSAGSAATSAYNSIFIGGSAGQNATSANNSVFLGGSAGQGATSASSSNFLGVNAGLNATGASGSNFFGNGAGQVTTTSSASNGNFFGTNAGKNATGASNSNFFGSSAGNGATSAQQSNFFGNAAGNGATGALVSNFFGSSSGSGATGASYSNFFGFQTGTSGTHVITGPNNILIGTNITTPAGNSTNTLNIGGVLYGSGLYGTTTGNPTAAAQTAGKIGIALTTPTSTLTVNGSFGVAYTAQTTTYTATATDHTIDCTTGTFTVTLPTAVGITGRVYVIKNSGAGTITMAGTSAQTFDGATSPTIAAGAVAQYQSNGANWIKIN